MLRESQLREILLDALQERRSLEDFHEWLSAARYNMHLDSSVATQELVGQVSLALYEYFEGHQSERGLREDLARLASQIVAYYRAGPESGFASGTAARSQQAVVLVPA